METMQVQETTTDSTLTLDLDQLIREINDEHHATVQAMRDGLAHARRAGELLLHVKAKLMHGAFMAWVERYCEFSHRTATMYMRIAGEWDKITANWQSVANFGIAEADQWLSQGDVDVAETRGSEAGGDSPGVDDDEPLGDEKVEADPLATSLSSVDGALADLRPALVALRQYAVGRIEVRQDDVRDVLTLVDEVIARCKKIRDRRWRLLGRWEAGGLLNYVTADDGGAA